MRGISNQERLEVTSNRSKVIEVEDSVSNGVVKQSRKIEMRVKVELHSHTYISDGSMSPDAIVKIAKSRGLDAIAVTDHDSFRGSILASRYAKLLDIDILVLYGAEILTDIGDVLLICVEPLYGGIPRDVLGLRDVAVENNCVTIAPHPFHILMPSVKSKLYEKPELFDAIEVWNSKSIPLFNIPAIIAARRLGKPGVSGSDAHVASAVGVAPTIIYTDKLKSEDIIEAIRRGRVIPTIKGYNLKILVEDLAWSLFRRIP
ncbi:MAG: PHP domain-containing protein [Acidilobaceae archaeon]